uniref:Transcriptional regulator, AcrR family n=1 Tax=Parastrongyloides trichosuri TaxID=131310 RepID=A0A0N4ZEC7_PARTI
PDRRPGRGADAAGLRRCAALRLHGPDPDRGGRGARLVRQTGAGAAGQRLLGRAPGRGLCRQGAEHQGQPAGPEHRGRSGQYLCVRGALPGAHLAPDSGGQAPHGRRLFHPADRTPRGRLCGRHPEPARGAERAEHHPDRRAGRLPGERGRRRQRALRGADRLGEGVRRRRRHQGDGGSSLCRHVSRQLLRPRPRSGGGLPQADHCGGVWLCAGWRLRTR